MIRAVAVTLAFALMAASVWADVIPTRHADGEAEGTRGAVAARLEGLGLPPSVAESESLALADEEARYFAERPERVQVAGQTELAADAQIGYGEKMLYGAVVLVGILGGGVWWERRHHD